MVGRPLAEHPIRHSSGRFPQGFRLGPLNALDARQRYVAGEALLLRFGCEALRGGLDGLMQPWQLLRLVLHANPGDAWIAQVREKPNPLSAQRQRAKSPAPRRLHVPQEPQRQVELLAARPADAALR